MAKVEDVVVSDRVWRWREQPPEEGKVIFHMTFTIITVDAVCGYARYRYENGGTAARMIAIIAACADPVPAKCRDFCTPANPCGTAGVCRGDHEPTVGQMRAVNTLYAVAEMIRRLEAAPEPIELRCGRDLACGLFRVS